MKEIYFGGAEERATMEKSWNEDRKERKGEAKGEGGVRREERVGITTEGLTSFVVKTRTKTAPDYRKI